MRSARRGAVLLALLVGASARGEPAGALTERVVEALTSTDTLASNSDLATIFNGSDAAVTQLAAIAQDPTADVGVQLRAIRGLSQFPGHGTVPHDTLLAIVATNATARTGSPVLLLRAAIEALGTLAAGGAPVPGDAAALVDHLNDASRDVRASTAHTLGELCDATALAPLRIRLQTETSEQVRLAISEALRVLGSCGGA